MRVRMYACVGVWSRPVDDDLSIEAQVSGKCMDHDGKSIYSLMCARIFSARGREP